MQNSKKTAVPNVFVFDKYALDKKNSSASFFYRLEFSNGSGAPIELAEKVMFGGRKIDWKKVNRKLLERALFNLHLALGVSYYKTYCPRTIKIKSGALTKDEAMFWNKLYTKGLGEFFYKNKLDFRGLVKFPATKKNATHPIRTDLKDRCLLPWGGGKDSIVAGEKLKALGHAVTLFSLGDSRAQLETAEAFGTTRIVWQRHLDPQLFAMNAAGAMNGHVPVSSIFAFSTALAAALYDYKHIVFSNEASANFGNVKYRGEEINHQYSKSREFENDLRQYLRNFVTPDIDCFSILRGRSELMIAAEFGRYPRYFSKFVSCNRHYSLNPNVKTRWCGSCPKCAFVFSQLAAFLPKQAVVKIFNKNLFFDAALLPLFQELWGEKRFKPFECVGEPKEVAAAMLLAGKNNAWSNDPIMKYYLRHRAQKIKDKPMFIAAALRLSPAPNIPVNFKKILILGYGREGRYAVRYLTGLYPRLRFGIADAKKIEHTPPQARLFSGANYLEAVRGADLIIKSPGISDTLTAVSAAKAMGREVTTVTNIFLEKAANRTIGVTGTKGKSTTASLIRAMLKAGGIKSELVGNIGTDPLKFIDDPDTVIVYELSSYQLSTARVSPHVSVFINIFPDHLPYHGGFVDYFDAKANISRHQKVGDHLIYNSDHTPIKKLAATGCADKVDYLKKGSVKNNWLCYEGKKVIPVSEIRLLGRHNIENIFAAIAAVKIYNVSNAAIRRALKKFTNLKHRLEFVGRYRGVDFYDDAISTTPESTLAAISVFEDRLGTIILGGTDRGYHFSGLADKLISLKLEGIVFFPDSGKRIALALREAARQKKIKLPPMLFTTSMDKAIRFCYGRAGHNKVCLLSTASPSYSLWKNFEEKGDLFQQAVKKYSA